MMKIGWQENVPTHVAFIIIMIFGLVVSLVTIRIGERIILNTPSMPYFQESMQVQAQINDAQ